MQYQPQLLTGVSPLPKARWWGGSEKMVNQDRELDSRTQQGKLQGCCYLCSVLYRQQQMVFGHIIVASTFLWVLQRLPLFFLFPVFPENGHSVVTLPRLGPGSVQVMEHLLIPQTLFCSLTFVSRPSLLGNFHALTSSCQVRGKGIGQVQRGFLVSVQLVLYTGADWLVSLLL